MPPAQVQQAASLGATLARERLLHASTVMPTAQGPESEAAQTRLEGPGTEEDAWQIPYNQAEYADEVFLPPEASHAAMHTAHHAASGVASARTILDGCQPAAVLPAPGYRLSTTAECLDVARSDVGLQAQYDTLLIDLAAQQQQQQQSHFPSTQLSRLWDQQHPAAIATAASLGPQSGSASANVSGCTSTVQCVQPEAFTADASTSPMTGTGTRGAYPASQVVVLPEDPFHQQLPQHLHELIKVPEDLSEQLPEQLPEHLHRRSQPQLSSGLSQLHHGSPQEWAASQPKLVQPASVSSTAYPLPQQPSMPQQHLAEDQLRLKAELPLTGTESAWSPPIASSALPSVVLPASAMEDPADRASHQVPDSDSHGTAADNAQQPRHKKLLRASLAEWLADAVASKLWVALDKQRQAAAPAGELGNPSTLPGRFVSMCSAVNVLSINQCILLFEA